MEITAKKMCVFVKVPNELIRFASPTFTKVIEDAWRSHHERELNKRARQRVGTQKEKARKRMLRG
jgi:hypothetical protein